MDRDTLIALIEELDRRRKEEPVTITIHFVSPDGSHDPSKDMTFVISTEATPKK